MYYLIYEIRNNKNDKVYVGKHKTKDINDNYMGSGKIIKRSIEKYGIENFTKTILFELETEQEMNEKEAEIVNEEFIRCESNYNLMVGGQGSWDYVNNSGKGLEGAKKGGKITSELGLKQNLGKTWTIKNVAEFNCKFCNKLIKSKGNLVQHEKSCINNPYREKTKRKPYKVRKKEENFKCNCGKIITGKASFNRHYEKCIDRKVN